MGILDWALGNPSDKEVDRYADDFMKTVENSLPQELKDVKKRALAGEAEAQYQIGVYYWNFWNTEGCQKNYARANKDTRAFYVAHHKAGMHFVYEAEHQGYELAKIYLRQHSKYYRG